MLFMSEWSNVKSYSLNIKSVIVLSPKHHNSREAIVGHFIVFFGYFLSVNLKNCVTYF